MLIRSVRAAVAAALTCTTVTALAAQPDTKVTGGSFNPAISLILDGKLSNFSQDPSTYALPGFALGEETGPGEEGLGLGESELVLSANIDDQFYGNFTAALTPENEVEIEEAFIETLNLGSSATIKAGRFFSHIGYLNNVHAHAWDFVDQPLVYRAMLGNQFGDDGAQLRWVAPTDLLIEIGAEVFRGEAFPAGGAAKSGKGVKTGFVHIGGDIGASNAWRVGLSRLQADSIDRASGDEAAPDLFSGESGGTIKYYENLDDETPDQAGPVFVALPSSNRLSEVAVSGGYSTPAFVDFGGDGDMDAYVGSGSGELQLWENVGAAFNNSTGDFVDNLDVVANTKASLVNRAAPALVDIDGNNRVDAFVGEETGTLRHYYNILNRYFDRTTEATLNPLFNIDIGSNSMPFFVDIDGDGDMDAFIGAADGTIKFYRNDTPIPADLTVTKTGTGSGTVTSSPTGINCGGTCTATFTGTVTLSAAATAGSTFAGWSGGGCSGTDTCEVTLTGDTTITATFSKVILVKWQSAAQAVAEDVGQVTVTAVLTDDAGQALTATAPVTVPFTVSGTATGSGTDHNLANGSIAIAVGLSAGNTTFTVTNDELKEAAETIIVTMGTPTNATAGSVVVHTVTITDNDAGDLNLDEKVDLVDAILALQVLTGQTPAASVSTAGDIDGDGRIGLGDVIFILERVDGQR